MPMNKYGMVGIAPGATVGDMIMGSQNQQKQMQQRQMRPAMMRSHPPATGQGDMGARRRPPACTDSRQATPRTLDPSSADPAAATTDDNAFHGRHPEVS